MGRLKLSALLLMIVVVFASCSKDNYKSHFYTSEQLNNIKVVAKTERGKMILEELRKKVDGRAVYGFEIPTETTIRLQNYTCPECKSMLKYDIESPHDHYCKKCDKSYKDDYLDACWRNYYQREMATFISDCGKLYLATGNEKYFSYLKEIFLKYADVYPGYPDYTDDVISKKYHLGKMFEQFIEESIWFRAACPIYDAISCKFTEEERHKIEENLFRKAANMILKRKGGHNWRTLNNTMRAHLAMVLNDSELMNRAIYDEGGFMDDMEKMVFNDGWSKEASQGYHYMVLSALTETAIIGRQFGMELFGEKLKKMFVNVPKLTYYNKVFPAYNDGGYNSSYCEMSSLYELYYAHTHDNEVRNILSSIYHDNKRLSFESMLNKESISSIASPIFTEGYLFRDAGFAVLKSGKNTACLKYGYSEGGHGHPDRLSVVLHNGEKEILTDCGTYSYAQSVYTKWCKRGLSHNMVLVDGKDMNIKPDPSNGGKLLHFNSNKDGGSASAICDSNVYPGVTLKRSVSLFGGTFLDRFECKSDTEHTYDYVFALLGKPEFVEKDFKFSPLVGDSPAYDYAQKSLKRVYNTGDVTFQVEGAKFEIENKLQTPIEVYWAKAPNIDYEISSNGINFTGKTISLDAYMLVIRTKGKCLDITSRIELN